MHDTIALAHDAHSLAEHRGTFVDEPPRELEDSQEGDLRMDVEAAYEHAHPESSPNLDYEEVLNTVTGKVRRDE